MKRPKLIPYSEEKNESAAVCAIRAIKKLRTGIKLGKELVIKELKAPGRR